MGWGPACRVRETDGQRWAQEEEGAGRRLSQRGGSIFAH